MFEAYVTTEVASKLEKSVEVVSIAADSNPLQTYLLRKFILIFFLTVYLEFLT